MSVGTSAQTQPVHGASGSAADFARQERAIWLCLLIDVVTFIPCVTVALLSGSMLLLSDVMDYAKSFASSGVSLHILRGIRQGRVGHYDYGPGKIEQFGGLFGALCYVAGLIALGGFAFHRLLHPLELHTGFTAMGMGIQAIGFCVHLVLWRYNKRLAKDSRSPLIEMQWRNNRTDAYANLAVLAALALTLIFRSSNWEEYIDPICTLIYVAYATGLYVPTIRDTLHDLMDHTLGEDLQLKIVRHLAAHYNGYEALHYVRSRRSGSRNFIEIALSFDPDKRIGEALDTIIGLRAAIEADIPLSEVAITLRPAERFNLARAEKTSIQILPLSPATLEPAVGLIERTFDLRPDELPRQELEECLWPGKHALALAKIGVSDPRYWVAFYKQQVVGVAGLVSHPADRHEAVWGGWTVYADQKREGLSRARFLLLRKLAIEAAGANRKYFRLETSTDAVSRAANRFYDRIGLTVYKTEERGHGRGLVLYRQAEVAKITPYFA